MYKVYTINFLSLLLFILFKNIDITKFKKYEELFHFKRCDYSV